MRENKIALLYMDLCQNAYEELTLIDSLLCAIQEACLNLEMKSEYYNSKEPSTLKISEERNRYINLTSIAHERIKKMEYLNSQMENKAILLAR